MIDRIFMGVGTSRGRRSHSNLRIQFFFTFPLDFYSQIPYIVAVEVQFELAKFH